MLVFLSVPTIAVGVKLLSGSNLDLLVPAIDGGLSAPAMTAVVTQKSGLLWN